MKIATKIHLEVETGTHLYTQGIRLEYTFVVVVVAVVIGAVTVGAVGVCVVLKVSVVV